MSADEVVATVTVRADAPSSVRPSRARVEEAAAYLRGRGFDVLHIGRFGVSVRGRIPLFERELGVRLVPPKTVFAAVQAREPNLARLLDRVEFAPPAENFSSEK